MNKKLENFIGEYFENVKKVKPIQGFSGPVHITYVWGNFVLYPYPKSFRLTRDLIKRKEIIRLFLNSSIITVREYPYATLTCGGNEYFISHYFNNCHIQNYIHLILNLHFLRC